MHNVEAQRSKNKGVGTRRRGGAGASSICPTGLVFLFVRRLVIPVTLLWVEEVPPLPVSYATSLAGGD